MIIDTKEVKSFFDELAPTWDLEQVDRSEVIEKILGVALSNNSKKVLDVACGSGILFPYYINRGVTNVLGIDISPKMIELAKEKCKSNNYENNVRLIAGDILTLKIEEKFSAIVIYNAYPHFPDGERLVKTLYQYLEIGGRLTIAHGFSRDTINMHHSGSANHVSRELEEATVLGSIFENNHLLVNEIISDEEKYIVSGTKTFD